MVPKKIHYCWLSSEEQPLIVQNCINSWKEVMPDYEIICWDQKRFNIESIPFVNEACSVKKWAFASDYIRLYALYTEGGIYLDSDVVVQKKFDPFLNFDFFTSVEYHSSLANSKKTKASLLNDGTSKKPFTPINGIGIQAAIIGGCKGHPFLKDCLDFYKNKHFILSDGSFFQKIIAPSIYSMILEKYGFKYIDKSQNLKNNIMIFPSEIFPGSRYQENNNSFAVHLGLGSWRDKNTETYIKMWSSKLKGINFIRKILRKPLNTICKKTQ